jgi:hypothetical protein
VEATAIRCLRANVTREEAVRIFRAPGPSRLYWKWRGGRLERIADVYVPFHLYRVRYQAAGGARAHLFGMDAVDGSLDLFEFPEPPGEGETVVITTRNHPASLLTERRGEELLREKVLRLIFQQGFFKVLCPRIDLVRLPGEIYVPYWLGFYGTGENLRCRAMDAVRRQVEGARASAFFEQWLAA